MKKVNISINPSMRTETVNSDRLLRHAASIAEGIIMPAGIEFAQFEFNGRTYALAAKVTVEINLLSAQVPRKVFRDGDMRRALEAQKERARQEKLKTR